MMLDHDSRFFAPHTVRVSLEAPGLSSALLEFDARTAIRLYEVGRMVTASSDLEATLEVVIEATHHLTGSESTVLALFEADGSLVVRAARGGVQAVGQSVDLAAGVSARALREGLPVLVADQTCLVVPLILQAERLGILTVTMGAPNALGSRDVALVGALAEQAAAAVGHASDYAEERRQRGESQEILRQFSEQAVQLERVQQQLIQNEKLTAIGQLVQGLAHEMNTPLSVVTTNLSVLGRHADNLLAVAGAAQTVLPQLLAEPAAATLVGPLDSAIRGADLEYTIEDLPELLTDSNTAVRRLAELVRSMANFARRDTGGPTAMAVEVALEAALTLASNPLKQCAKVVCEFAPTPPVRGLASELTELFLHLLMNAAQALEEQPGTVTITTACDAEWVVVSIHDTGHGISAEHLSRVFDPFFTTRPVGGGTGMGLAVCYGIVARHGGSIVVDSQPGAGTTVSIRLPVAE
jgi:signal transduction histidine kinase